MPTHNPLPAMTKWFVSLVLVLTLGGGVLAGMPMHSGGSESGMMDCCKKAMEQSNSPHVAAARLCCAMNCNEPGSTAGNTSQNFSRAGLEASSPSVLPFPPVTNYKPLRAHYGSISSTHSEPTYILNLALLI
jgi:hypothetical protein